MAEAVESSRCLPDKAYFRELRRPWKLASLAIGMLWLMYGAVSYGISDWDVGISLIMGGLTYLCAPWSVRNTGTPYPLVVDAVKTGG